MAGRGACGIRARSLKSQKEEKHAREVEREESRIIIGKVSDRIYRNFVVNFAIYRNLIRYLLELPADQRAARFQINRQSVKTTSPIAKTLVLGARGAVIFSMHPT